MCPLWSMLPLFPKGYTTSLLIVRRKEFCSQKLSSSLLVVWHWWALGSVRNSESMQARVNGEEHEHSWGSHMIKPTESGVNKCLLAHCLGKCVFTKFHSEPFSPRLSLKTNVNIPLYLGIGENEETGSGGVLFILDLYVHLHPWQMFLPLINMVLYKLIYQPLHYKSITSFMQHLIDIFISAQVLFVKL